MSKLNVPVFIEWSTVLTRLDSGGGLLRILKARPFLSPSGHKGMQTWKSGRYPWVFDLERVDGNTAGSRWLNDLRRARQLRVVRRPRRVSRFLFPAFRKPLCWDRESLPINFSQPLSC